MVFVLSWTVFTLHRLRTFRFGHSDADCESVEEKVEREREREAVGFCREQSRAGSVAARLLSVCTLTSVSYSAQTLHRLTVRYPLQMKMTYSLVCLGHWPATYMNFVNLFNTLWLLLWTVMVLFWMNTPTCQVNEIKYYVQELLFERRKRGGDNLFVLFIESIN